MPCEREQMHIVEESTDSERLRGNGSTVSTFHVCGGGVWGWEIQRDWPQGASERMQ